MNVCMHAVWLHRNSELVQCDDNREDKINMMLMSAAAAIIERWHILIIAALTREDVCICYNSKLKFSSY